MSEYPISVRGEAHVVAVTRRPGRKRVWVASGTYAGVSFKVEDRSEVAAVLRWQEAAILREK
jgi:hypothetical protein